MSNLTVTQNNSHSPFDSIRLEDADGEYWLARELMPLLGYVRWNEFEDVVDRAKAACLNTGNSVLQHFSGLTLKTKGRPQQEYRLSRYACYLTAQNGDPRKPEVAAAQSYFAIKAREAEVIIPAQSDRIKELELELQLTVAQTQKAIAEQKVLDTRHLIVTTCPEVVQQKILGYTEVKTIEYRDRTITPTGQINDGIGITYIQKRYGFKSTKETWAWLERLGMGKMDGKWKHELRAVESSVLPREYLDELDVMFGDSQRPLWLGE